MALAQHLSTKNEHYTPWEVIKLVRRVMGKIDLDPCSDSIGNNTVLANKYYTKQQNGLKKPWRGKIFCNPPGGKMGNKPQVKIFWEKLCQEWMAKNIKEAIFLAFSVEFLQVGQSSYISPTAFPICIPEKRIQFLDCNGKKQKQPTHSNAIIYIPGNKGTFVEEFLKIGDVINAA
jgi:hypothetical protein